VSLIVLCHEIKTKCDCGLKAEILKKITDLQQQSDDRNAEILKKITDLQQHSDDVNAEILRKITDLRQHSDDLHNTLVKDMESYTSGVKAWFQSRGMVAPSLSEFRRAAEVSKQQQQQVEV
jgi:uncharacterized coiled-coil DUF342 family protein